MRYDETVTNKVLDIMGVHLQHERGEVSQRVQTRTHRHSSSRHQHPSRTARSANVGRVDLLDNLRQRVDLLLDQRGDGPTQRRAPARPHLRGVCLPPSSALPQTLLSKNSSPAALILPPSQR